MHLEDLPLGAAPRDKVRVDVKAAGINFFDSLVVAGTYQSKPELPFIPGAEVAGTVVYAPPGSGFVEGDRVMARLKPDGIQGGGYAETAHADPDHTVKIPQSMSFEHAAASRSKVVWSGWDSRRGSVRSRGRTACWCRATALSGSAGDSMPGAVGKLSLNAQRNCGASGRKDALGRA